MEKVTLEHFKTVCPNCKRPEEFVDAMNALFPDYRITNQKRISAFLAQTAYESGGYRRFRESMNYSAKRLNAVFPKYFVRAGRLAEDYHRQPEKIANVVYGGRMGNVLDGDGWRFIGRGCIQLTGRNNYEAFYKATGVDAVTNPDVILESAANIVLVGCFFWKMRNLNPLADMGQTEKITRKIVGGRTESLKDRIALYRKSLQYWEKTSPKSCE